MDMLIYYFLKTFFNNHIFFLIKTMVSIKNLVFIKINKRYIDDIF